MLTTGLTTGRSGALCTAEMWPLQRGAPCRATTSTAEGWRAAGHTRGRCLAGLEVARLRTAEARCGRGGERGEDGGGECGASPGTVRGVACAPEEVARKGLREGVGGEGEPALRVAEEGVRGEGGREPQEAPQRQPGCQAVRQPGARPQGHGEGVLRSTAKTSFPPFLPFSPSS